VLPSSGDGLGSTYLLGRLVPVQFPKRRVPHCPVEGRTTDEVKEGQESRVPHAIVSIRIYMYIFNNVPMSRRLVPMSSVSKQRAGHPRIHASTHPRIHATHTHTRHSFQVNIRNYSRALADQITAGVLQHRAVH
jgi:hypothetical protein